MAEAEASKVVLDHKGIAELLKSAEFHALVTEAAHRVRDAAREIAGNGANAPYVPVHTYTTDRAAASVSVPAHRQAREGLLTKAFTEVGLEVRERA